MFKTLFMDADDTIFDFGAAQRAALFATFDALDLPLTEEEYKLYDAINLRHWKKLERGETTKQRLIYERFEDLYSAIGKPGDVVKTEDLYQNFLGEQAFWLPGAKEGVEKLSNRYEIYILTNGYASSQLNRVRKSGLRAFVKDVYVSEAVGYNKPDKAYYDYCLAHSGADKGQTLCIGDSLTSDIQGAINAGIKTLWCNFSFAPTPPTPIDFIVYSWDDILSILL